ncbi:hypothetical protein [Kroppenstedtia eburnea]|uniref:Uncharacterized protein n=1 Tax=Kroppenstedtia eburnea TaxID=714067 RepID=A0A1N7NAV5_9BACL|nr:hypothetical protein [Kroppenstedtia eburnea]SIS95436.1 hypothetical protein SAMN05421790_10891 [Kroppenstedtia eburnea]
MRMSYFRWMVVLAVMYTLLLILSATVCGQGEREKVRRVESVDL